MNFRFRSLSLTAVGLSVIALSAGCEVSKCKTDDGRDATCAESLEVYPGDEETLTADYMPGMDLTIEQVKGDILLVPGEPGVVTAIFKPFTYRGHSKDAEAAEDLASGISKEVRTDGNVVVVETLQTGGWDEVGAALTVAIPPEFDGALRVTNHSVGNLDEANIDTEPGAVGNAFAVHMESQGLGFCDLDGTPLIVDTYAACRGEIEIVGVSDNVTAYSDGIISDDENAVRVSWSAISDTASGEIESTDGQIELNLPSTGNFTIAAATNADGAVQMNPAPDGCELSADNVLTCGTGDAQFVVSAGTEDDFDPANVNISWN